MQVKSTVKMNFPRIKQLIRAAATALGMTAETLHTEVVQAQMMLFDTGCLEENSFFADYNYSRQEKATLVVNTSYAHRLYCHPEYDFQTDENPFTDGEWYKSWLLGGVSQDFARNASRRFHKKVGGV